MPAQKTDWTAEMVRMLPDDGNRYEVVRGELLVTPAPSLRHQWVLAKLFRLIDPYVSKHRLGWTFWSPADIEMSPDTTVQPDLFVVPDEGSGEPATWDEVRKLLLVIEGLSPSTASHDRLKKRPAYQQFGVPEYWIIDIESRLAERWRPDDDRPEIITDVLLWQPRQDIPPLQIMLEEVFGPER